VAIAGAEGCGTLFRICFSHRRGTAVRIVGDMNTIVDMMKLGRGTACSYHLCAVY
jgi:hypothetical protein